MDFDNVRQPFNTIISNQSELTTVEWEEIRVLAVELNSAAPRNFLGIQAKLEDVFRLFCRMAEDARVYKEYGPFFPGPIDKCLKLDSNVERREDLQEEEKRAA